MNLEFSKRNFLALLAGLVTIVLIGIVTSTASFHQPYLAFRWLIIILSFLSPVLGGFVVGWITRERGWFYGALSGVIVQLGLIIVILVSYFFLSTEIKYSQSNQVLLGFIAIKNIMGTLLNSAQFIILAALGGYLGESLRKNRKR